MSNYTPNTLTGDLAPINAELEKVAESIADQLDRRPAEGESNQMEAVIDMNSNRIINLPVPVDSNDAARLKDIQDVVSTGLPDQTGNSGKFLGTDGEVASWQNLPEAAVSSVNGEVGDVVLDADDISDTSTSNKFWVIVSSTAELVSINETDTGKMAVVTDYGNAVFKLAAEGYVALFGDVTASNGRVWELQLNDTVNAAWFGILPDGNDQSSNMTNTLARLAGRVLFVPNGTYVFQSSINVTSPEVQGIFSSGIKIRGESSLNTIFDNQIANEALFVIDGPVPSGSYAASWGSFLTDFSIVTTTSPSNSIGIRLINAYEVNIERFYIKDIDIGILMQNGTEIDDGWNMVNIRSGWIENAAQWGIKADGSAGRNEGSYTNLEHVFFQVCGTNDGGATPPTSGAMIWKGQILNIKQCAAANGCQNVALYLKGESGLGQSVLLDGFTSENTVGWGLYCDGISNLYSINSQIYNNDTFQSQTMVEFNADTYTLRNINIEGTTIRATSGNNPCTAFKVSGNNTDWGSVGINRTNWDNFDFAGQVRYDGFKDKPYSLANKTAAQSLFNSVSDIVWDNIISDAQDCLDSSNGRWTIPYPTLANFEGAITLENMDAGATVVFNLYEFDTASILKTVTLTAAGIATETFQFDFTEEVGQTGATRSYTIRATQGSVGSKAIDITPTANNFIRIRRELQEE